MSAQVMQITASVTQMSRPTANWRSMLTSGLLKGITHGGSETSTQLTRLDGVMVHSTTGIGQTPEMLAKFRAFEPRLLPNGEEFIIASLALALRLMLKRTRTYIVSCRVAMSP